MRYPLSWIPLLIAVAVSTIAVVLAQSDGNAIDVKIAARQLDDGRVEFALEQDGELIYPRSRFFPADVGHSRWLKSSTIQVAVATDGDMLATDDEPSTSNAQTQPCTISSAYQSGRASTVKVVTNQGTGTAFYIGNGEFVTAAHVVEGVASVSLLSYRMPRTTGEVVGFQTGSDIAIIRAESTLPALSWRAARPAAGMTVGIAGYPGGLGTQASVSSGVVSRVFTEGSVSYVQTDAAASPGNSGGPLFDACGLVVGVISSKLAGVAYEGVTFAVTDPTLERSLTAIRRGEAEGNADPSTVERANLWIFIRDGELRYDGMPGALVVSALAFAEVDRFDLDVLISTDKGLTSWDIYNRSKMFPDEFLQLGGGSTARVNHTAINYVRASVDQGSGHPAFEMHCAKHIMSDAEVSAWACLAR